MKTSNLILHLYLSDADVSVCCQTISLPHFFVIWFSILLYFILKVRYIQNFLYIIGLIENKNTSYQYQVLDTGQSISEKTLTKPITTPLQYHNCILKGHLSPRCLPELWSGRAEEKICLFVFFISAQPLGRNADSVVKTLPGLWYLLSKVNFSNIKSQPNIVIMGYFLESINRVGQMLSLVLWRLQLTRGTAKKTVQSCIISILDPIFTHKNTSVSLYLCARNLRASSHALDLHAVCSELVTLTQSLCNLKIHIGV